MNHPVRIESVAWSDVRFGVLASMMGYVDADHAIVKVAKVWAWQTGESARVGHPVYHVPDVIIATVMGAGAVDALLNPVVNLAAREDDHPGKVYMRGTRKPGRIDWLLAFNAGDAGRSVTSNATSNRANGGRARAAGAERVGGRFVPRRQHPPPTDQHHDDGGGVAGDDGGDAGASTTSIRPASPAVLISSLPSQKERERPTPPSPEVLGNRYREAQRLYAMQEEMRKGIDPRARSANMVQTTDAIVRLLAAGETPDDLEYVLRVYEGEARARDTDKLKWFNGVTNWKPECVGTAKSRDIPGAPPATVEPIANIGAPRPAANAVGDLTPEQERAMREAEQRLVAKARGAK